MPKTPDWWRLDETPAQVHARALYHFVQAERLLALLPTDYFADSFTRHHGDPVRGEEIEASEIEGVTA